MNSIKRFCNLGIKSINHIVYEKNQFNYISLIKSINHISFVFINLIMYLVQLYSF